VLFRSLPAWFVRWSNARRDPLDKFRKIAELFGEACRVYVAWVGQEPVASAVFLMYKDHAFYYRGTSIREKANPVRANDLLQCMMIQAACQAGCRYYHLGESGGVESLMRFKSGFGAVALPVMGYAIERLPMTAAAQGVERILKRVEQRLLGHTE
jgi:lipid II:glycine glycyltransferase (peptidoglycan interpeptide bridge formation enzyme)